jgi:hypothetical protein
VLHHDRIPRKLSSAVGQLDFDLVPSRSEMISKLFRDIFARKHNCEIHIAEAIQVPLALLFVAAHHQYRHQETLSLASYFPFHSSIIFTKSLNR